MRRVGAWSLSSCKSLSMCSMSGTSVSCAGQWAESRQSWCHALPGGQEAAAWIGVHHVLCWRDSVTAQRAFRAEARQARRNRDRSRGTGSRISPAAASRHASTTCAPPHCSPQRAAARPAAAGTPHTCAHDHDGRYVSLNRARRAHAPSVWICC
jgi:hypothetical protein